MDIVLHPVVHLCCWPLDARDHEYPVEILLNTAINKCTFCFLFQFVKRRFIGWRFST